MTVQRTDHDYFRLLAAAGIDGEITPSEMLELRAHLASCDACRADEQAMRRDNAWLASAEAAQPSPPSVRAAVISAARGAAPRSMRLRLAPMLTAGLVILVAGGALFYGMGRAPSSGALASAGTASPTSSPTAQPPDLWSIPPGALFGRVQAHLLGNSVGASPEIIVSGIVIGGSAEAPRGYLHYEDPTGLAWTGSITRASYFWDSSGGDRVVRIEGCREGGAPPCSLYALQLIDGRERSDGQDEISISFPEAGEDPEPWDFWYRVVSGGIDVDGPIPDCCPMTPDPALTWQGSWTTTDCATKDAETVDCGQWGDRSTLDLVIGPGERPAAQFTDSAVPGCGPGGSVGPRHASGTGEHEGIFLWLTFADVDCAAPSESWANPMQLYLGPGEPTIWYDPDGDGWGLLYRPA